MPYVLSLGVGFAVGGLYALLGVRSPAPPVIALLGLLGMLAGEQLVGYLRGHPDTLAALLHTKSFSHSAEAPKKPGPEQRGPDVPS